jgi:transglutaminase-like putative cysteine protease
MPNARARGTVSAQATGRYRISLPATRSRRGFASLLSLLPVLVLVVVLVSPSGVAAADVTDIANVAATFPADDLAPSTIESDVHSFTLKDDGSIDEIDDTVLRANTTAGVDEIAQRYIWFDKNIDQVEVLAAETITADGTHIAVSPAQIRDVQEPRSADAPTFSDAELKAVIFPAVGAGSRVHLRFHKLRTRPTIPRQFSHLAEPARVPVESQKLIFDLPADRPLHADAQGYTAIPPVTAAGRTRYEFDYRRVHFNRPERGSIAFASYGDRLLVTTFPDYAAFAASYREAARDASADDPYVRALAESLTAGETDPRDKARTLYDWMRMNIRYVALLLGETAAAPHKVTDILANRYGDCKDHVALFGALLSAVGIRNEAALLNLGEVYTLPSVPGYGGAAINHVIVWMPELGTFADTTAGGIEFGYLPAGVMDRPALLVEQGILVHTPATQALGRTVHLQMQVDADGAASYAYDVEDSGSSAELERNRLRRAGRQQRAAVVAERLQASGLQGDGTLSTSPLEATAGSFQTSIHGKLEHLVWPTGTTAIGAFSSFSGGIASQLRAWLTETARTQPYHCPNGEFDETGVVAFASRFGVTDMPADIELHSDTVDYQSHYLFDAQSQVIQVSRHLSAHFGSTVCPAAGFAASREILLKAERDAMSQVIVKAR